MILWRKKIVTAEQRKQTVPCAHRTLNMHREKLVYTHTERDKQADKQRQMGRKQIQLYYWEARAMRDQLTESCKLIVQQKKHYSLHKQMNGSVQCVCEIENDTVMRTAVIPR